jgi:CCR4-NOT transcription complex subunit 1
MQYVGDLLKPNSIAEASKTLYRGVLRVLLVMHHDFPEFLAENHFRLCEVIPPHCTQLRNLVLSAYPSSFPELPDPFTDSLGVDKLPEVRVAPTVSGDLTGPIRRAKILDTLIAALTDGPSVEHVSIITDAIYTSQSRQTAVTYVPVQVNVPLVNSLVLFIGRDALNQTSTGPTFVAGSPQALLLSMLAIELHAEARYYFLSAIANHLRYPNSHTYYFSYALLSLFSSAEGEPQDSDVRSDIRQQITRVLLERLIVHRPHPWGLIVTLLEILKNPLHNFWNLPFIKAAPEVRHIFKNLACT